ncbi:MAG: Gfo/Idh/MocA family oxidoreductase [Planctomycetes bacterium]|nr:Gfo/Idh/MocA family oxidoreductase [Planctomycetota bacterium]
MTAATRIGIVGAGRTRNGLGPFLASALERAGLEVAAVAGRDLASARRAAAALGAGLGHGVEACASLDELAAGVDALVISSPAEAHLEALEVALAAGLPCLCEKPLALPEQTERGLAVAAAFEAAGVLLMENCQWPFVLPALHALWPELAATATAVASLEMGLGPTGRGPTMVRDSLSHVLSLAQSVADIDAEAGVGAVRQVDAAATAERNVVQFELRRQDGGTLAVALHLEHRERQPRPAWIALDGRRVDRRLGPDYSWSLVTGDGREQALPDPMHALVYRFAAAQNPGPLDPGPLDDPRIHIRAIVARLRWFSAIIGRLDGFGSGPGR